MNTIKRAIQQTLNLAGFEIRKLNQSTSLPPDMDQTFLDLYEKCKPYTMTSIERMFGLHQAVKYVVQNNIPGSFVECGVWRGGSSMMTALTLQSLGATDREIFLYDTFTGMSAPVDADKRFDGVAAEGTYHSKKKDSHVDWCYASLDDVKANLQLTAYPNTKLHFIKGPVELTLPAQLPSNPIALLRLDTDFYESTQHELKHLYPLVVKNGVVIVDDYGHWLGARKAVDEYFTESRFFPLLCRMDYTGRVCIKS